MSAPKGNRNSRKHGHAILKTSIYRVWQSMKSRCYNPNATGYARYGGLGIKVCKRWLKFENFFKDMKPKPMNKSLDRFPNKNGDYKLSNCRWATRSEQRKNRRWEKFQGAELGGEG